MKHGTSRPRVATGCANGYSRRTAPRNLADPSYEPGDDEFRELLHRAGDDARAGRIAMASALRAKIAAAREKALDAFARGAAKRA